MRTYLAALMIALAVLALPFVERLARQVLEPPPAPDAPGPDAEPEALERLRADLKLMENEIDALRDDVARLRERGFERDEELSRVLEGGAAAPGDEETTEEEEPEPLVGEGDQFAQVMLLTGRRNVNAGVRRTRTQLLLELFGPPRQELTDECQPITNDLLRSNIATEDVGPIRASLLRPALDSLRSVFDEVREYEPVLYQRISSAGSLCVRRIRGTENALSTHAFGASIDLNIDGHLDTLGDGKTQFGLILLAEFFNAAGWYWGASFGREDSMHFEVGEELLRQWAEEGLLVTR